MLIEEIRHVYHYDVQVWRIRRRHHLCVCLDHIARILWVDTAVSGQIVAPYFTLDEQAKLAQGRSFRIPNHVTSHQEVLQLDPGFLGPEKTSSRLKKTALY